MVQWQWGLSSTLLGVAYAASLAHQRLLDSVLMMRMCDVDLTSVPDDHLASLVSCVTSNVHIENVSGCDFRTILNSVRCERLYITRQSLGSEETQALVRAMESRVSELELNGGCSTMTLDINTLTSYNGLGKCTKVKCYNNTAHKYRKELRTWARSRNWRVTSDTYDSIYLCDNSHKNEIVYVRTE